MSNHALVFMISIKIQGCLIIISYIMMRNPSVSFGCVAFPYIVLKLVVSSTVCQSHSRTIRGNLSLLMNSWTMILITISMSLYDENCSGTKGERKRIFSNRSGTIVQEREREKPFSSKPWVGLFTLALINNYE